MTIFISHKWTRKLFEINISYLTTAIVIHVPPKVLTSYILLYHEVLQKWKNKTVSVSVMFDYLALLLSATTTKCVIKFENFFNKTLQNFKFDFTARLGIMVTICDP